jgi:hypothetical protein
MKITGNHGISVNISSARELGSLLKNISPGDSISAKVISSEGSKARLDLGGRIITAEFTNGVPREKNIELILTAKTRDMIQFSLKEKSPAERLFRFLSPFAMLPEDEIKNTSLQNLARFINTGKHDLTDINLFLLGMRKDERRDKNTTAFFNRLLLKGVPFQTLIDLSYLVYSKYNPVLFAAYQFMLSMSGRKPFNQQGGKELSFEEASDHLCALLKEDDADFYLMLDLISDEDKSSEMYGELAFPDDDGFSRIEYVFNENSIFFKFDLSAAGQLGVFVKSDKDIVTINFLSEKNDLILFMKGREDALRGLLENSGVKKSIIGYFDSKKIVDKLELWSLDFYTKSGFSVKA